MNIIEATKSYEGWLCGFTPLVESERNYKHRQMADPDQAFSFFRGTYYRWLQHWPCLGQEITGAPSTLSVGDLHVANFGTWRDYEGRLCWGVNDFDEADERPYTNDLIRLATSAWLIKRAIQFDIKFKKACRMILQGYRQTLEMKGDYFVLEEDHPELRALAMSADRDPVPFWKKLAKSLDSPEIELPPDVKDALRTDIPDHVALQFRRRERVGMGSLGKPRYLVIGKMSGGWIARDAKRITPPATAWALQESRPSRIKEFHDKAIRCRDPYYRAIGDWLVRRLAPRCSRIEVDSLHRVEDVEQVLYSMGAETANVHLGGMSDPSLVIAHLEGLPENWLPDSAKTMAMHLIEDWKLWCQKYRHNP